MSYMDIEGYKFYGDVKLFSPATRRLECEVRVPASGALFDNHFPEFPILPGAVLIETMAQCGGILQMGLSGFARLPFLASVREAKLRKFVRPEDTLLVAAVVDHAGSGYAIVSASIKRGDERVCEARLQYGAMDFPSQKVRHGYMEDLRRAGLPVFDSAASEVGTHG